MHITFWLTTPGRDRSICLPSANLHLFQSLLYSLLPPEKAASLHDNGYEADGKKVQALRHELARRRVHAVV